MIMTMYYVFYYFFYFLYLVPLCIFRVLLKKEKKKKENNRVNANMQLCLFIPIGMIKCWFGMVHTIKLTMLTKVDGGGGWHLRTDWNTFAYLGWNPMMSEASSEGQPVKRRWGCKTCSEMAIVHWVHVSRRRIIPSVVHYRMSTGAFKSCLLVVIIMI